MTLMNPFNSSTNIVIRLLRSGPENEDDSRDDKIAILRSVENVYELYYKDANMKGEVCHFKLLTADELDTYLECLFYLLTRDSDPFLSIQLNIPCMPCLLFRVEDLKKTTLRDSLHTILPLLHSCTKIEF
jgi:hypothetical protein